MTLDYISIGLSFVILIFYIITIILLLITKKMLKEEVSITFTYFLIAIFFLFIRRLEQIFINSQIINGIPYVIDITTLIFAILFFLGTYHLYKAVKTAIKRRPEKELKKSRERVTNRRVRNQRIRPKLKFSEKGDYIDLTR